MTPTEKLLAKLEELDKARTPGKWKLTGPYQSARFDDCEIVAFRNQTHTLAAGTVMSNHHLTTKVKSNRAFIAASSVALPALIRMLGVVQDSVGCEDFILRNPDGDKPGFIETCVMRGDDRRVWCKGCCLCSDLDAIARTVEI